MSGAVASGPTRDRRQALFDLVPLLLVIVAEGSWVAVAGWLVQEYSLHDPVIGIPGMAGFVAFGVLAARVGARRVGQLWPFVALGLVATGGVVGWLASPAARDDLATNLAGALAAHPGGWLAAVAVLRGFAHAALPLSEASVGRLLGLGLPGIAFASLVGGLVTEPFRGEFLRQSLVAAIVFVATATLALALARLGAVGRDAGFDWRRNPTWTAIVVLLVASAVWIALPLAGVAGAVLELVFAVALIPMLILGMTAGFDRTGRRILGFVAVAAALIIVFGRLFPAPAVVNRQPISVPAVPPAGTGDPAVAVGLGGLVIALAAAAILLLAAAWMRRPRPIPLDDVFETRSIDRSVGAMAPRRARRRERWTDPVDAAGAYLAVLHDLDRDPEARRLGAETPAEHARRLRETGAGGLPLDLLAADYALDRFGSVVLPDREHRRAIGRWRAMRRLATRT